MAAREKNARGRSLGLALGGGAARGFAHLGVLKVLAEEGIQVKAAAKLGIKERSLWHRLKKFQIDASEFKENT